MANTIRKNDELNNKHVKYHKKQCQTERFISRGAVTKYNCCTIFDNNKQQTKEDHYNSKNITALQGVFRTKLIG